MLSKCCFPRFPIGFKVASNTCAGALSILGFGTWLRHEDISQQLELQIFQVFWKLFLSFSFLFNSFSLLSPFLSSCFTSIPSPFFFLSFPLPFLFSELNLVFDLDMRMIYNMGIYVHHLGSYIQFISIIVADATFIVIMTVNLWQTSGCFERHIALKDLPGKAPRSFPGPPGGWLFFCNWSWSKSSKPSFFLSFPFLSFLSFPFLSSSLPFPFFFLSFPFHSSSGPFRFFFFSFPLPFFLLSSPI